VTRWWTTCGSRQPAIDYNTLTALATALGLWFLKDLERHHPGIDSLRLTPEIAAAWKQRVRTRVARSRNDSGEIVETTVERDGAADVLMTVRAFYLDLTQWALDDPARWGPWAFPCPIRATDVQHQKMKSRRKGRMDQRTRDRMPVLPILADAVDRERKAAAARLERATNAQPGEAFTVDGVTIHRAQLARHSPRIWAEEPTTGRRRDLTREEDKAFWSWATVEVSRMTGVRVEELTELSHHSLIQYRIPATGELVPLLQIPPSKTDQERLLVISPELADVLSAIVFRIRNPDGSVPLVVAYDHHEKVWNPPIPLLFQRTVGLETRPIPISGIRDLLSDALTHAGLTDATGKPLDFAPHDFRRIFTTDAILNGMPPHIAQLLLGHKDINTTWQGSTVRSILENPRYTGYAIFGRWHKHETLLDPDDVADGHVVRFRRSTPDRIVRSRRPAHPEIISVEDFTRAQLLRRSKGSAGLQSARKVERSRRTVKRPYLFRGRVRCDVCKRKMEGSPRKHAMYYRCPARTLAPESPVLAEHPTAVYLRESTLRDGVNSWLADLFHPDNVDQTVAALLASQGGVPGEWDGGEAARKRLADAESRIRKFQAAIAAGVDPGALVEAINAAQAERAAAHAEINNTPAPELMDAAEVYARIDMLGDVPAKLNDGSPEGLAEVYAGTNLQVVYEPETSIAEVSMRVNSVRVRGGT
jgi:integrase